VIADVRRYQPIVERHTLALFSLTTVQSGRIGIDLPLYQDFHLGGTNTVRGWDLDAIRGKNQHLATVEYRITLLDPSDFRPFGDSFPVGVQLAAFGDLGVAWGGGDDDGAQTLDGYGVGVRLLVPFVDVVRLDFAFGQPGAGWGRYGGVLEKATMQRRRVR
jgi:outer membrane protein assembly factor BamA